MGEGVSIDKFTAELKRMSNGKDLITPEEFLEYSQKVLRIHRGDLEKAEKRSGREKKDPMDPQKHVDKIIDLLYGIPMCKLTILTGGNGKGKSLIRKQMPFAVQKAFQKEVSRSDMPSVCKSVSMQLRTESRPEFGALCSMAHDWPLTPTSISTYHLIRGLFGGVEEQKNSRHRGKRKKCYLIIDEPEIGMSRESQLGIAEYIKEQYLQYKDDIYGLLLITHSETIVKALMDISEFVSLDDYKSAEEWLNREVIPTDFEQLDKESEELFRTVRDREKPVKN